ncbi:MAG: hypothetical protein KTR31_13880 [Myxococcales bacterium]|nr:hypothetical protein [Myxococcales bacterium]
MIHDDPQVVLKLTGRATRWIQLLQDFGHVDIAGADQLVMAAANLHADLQVEGDRIDLGLVRRAAAMLLFPPGGEGTGPVLEEDWPLLFS